MEKGLPRLEVGQVWTFDKSAVQVAIVGLSRNLVEICRCGEGKVSRSVNLESRRTVDTLIATGRARLTGHVVFPDSGLNRLKRSRL